MIKKLLLSLIFMASLILPLHAQDSFINDAANTLTTDEINTLNIKITDIVNTYQVGIYLHTTNDRGNMSIEDYAESVYKTQNLGVGTEKNGVMLVLDFSDRSYDIVAYGDLANKSFTDYGKSLMEDAMLDDFRDEDWYEGYDDFISEAERQLYYSVKEDSPIDINNNPMSDSLKNLIQIGVPLIVSLIASISYVWYQASKNRTRGKAPSAAIYFSTQLQLTRHIDRFISSSQTVTHIPRNNSNGGGTSINAGGFSHSSGHF